MTRAQARAFANRPWERIRRAKDDYLIERLRRLGPSEAFRMADELRASVVAASGKAARLGRDADFAAHVRLHRLLARAGAAKRR